MKKFFFLAVAAFLFFGVSAFAAKDVVTDNDKISTLIAEYFPGLKDYYEAGVITVDRVEEEYLADGTTECNVFYKYVKNYYDQDEIDNVLKEQYPDLYMMKKHGVIKDVSVYKFVNKSTGEILTNVAYNSNLPHRRFGRHGR